MQLYAILNELWRRRIVVAIALVISVFIGLMVAFRVGPGGLTPRAREIGVASTRVLINTPSSIVADLNPAGGTSLPTHAQLLGNLLSSDQVHNAIAKSAGLAPADLTVSPLAVGGVVQTPLAVTAPAPVGASSVSVNADPLLPLITISATAPTPQQAAALANGSVKVLQTYIQTVAGEQNIPTSRRPVITSLGSAVGLPSTSGPSKLYSAIAIILLFGLSCYVILVVSGGKARIRELKELRAMEYERAIALAGADGEPATRGGESPAPATLPGGRPIGATNALDQLSEFEATAGLFTGAEDLYGARAADDEAATADESTTLIDGGHVEIGRGEGGGRNSHSASAHHRSTTRGGPALFSRFSRS